MRPGIQDDTERSDDRSTHRGQTGYRVTAGLRGEHTLTLRTRSHTHTPVLFSAIFSIWPNLVGARATAQGGRTRRHTMACADPGGLRRATLNLHTNTSIVSR